jgi:hypothetical protein
MEFWIVVMTNDDKKKWDENVDRQIKSDLEEIYRNTHRQMLEKHPDQKEIIDEMLKKKLTTIGKTP